MASYEDFLAIHLGQLMSIGLPENLYSKLYEKLLPTQVFDAGDFFVFTKSTDDESDHKGDYDLRAKIDIEKDSNVFIIDHTWSSDGGKIAKQQLEKFPQLLSRMQEMFSLTNNCHEGENQFLDSREVISEVCSCSVEEAKLALEAKEYNLIDSIIYKETNGEDLGKRNEDNADIECTYEEFKSAIFATLQDPSQGNFSEDYLKKLYTNFLKQNDKCQGTGMTLNYNWTDNGEDGFVYVYVAIKPLTQKDHITSILTPNTWKLDVENIGTIIEGNLFDKIVPEESWWSLESPGVLCMALQKSIKSDDLWSELIKGEKKLAAKEIEELAWKNEIKKSSEIGEVLDRMWFYNQTYKIHKAGSQEKGSASTWYVMDEVGSAISHSNTPNFACSPFFLLNKGIAFNLIWPIADIEQGDKITRNFMPKPLPNETPSNFQTRKSLMNANTMHQIVAPLKDEQSSNVVTADELHRCYVEINKNSKKCSLYCDFIDENNLSAIATALGCTIAGNMMNADIVLSSEQPSAESIRSDTLINHFQGEDCLHQKLHLRDSVLKYIRHPHWFPKTYSLLSEFKQLTELVCKKSTPSYWLIQAAKCSKTEFKPVVTSDINRISRLCEAGASIASEYSIDGPLCRDKKFSLTYTVLISALQPLKIYISKEPFVRFAKEKFNPLKLLDEYDTDAMIMTEPGKQFDESNQQRFEDVVESIDDKAKKFQHKYQWNDIEKDFFTIIGRLFNCLKHKMCSLKAAKSFTFVGVEFMLDAKLKPVLIGIDKIPTFASTMQLTEILTLLLCNNNATKSTEAAPFVQIISSWP